MFIRFNQKIDPAAVLATIKVERRRQAAPGRAPRRRRRSRRRGPRALVRRPRPPSRTAVGWRSAPPTDLAQGHHRHRRPSARGRRRPRARTGPGRRRSSPSTPTRRSQSSRRVRLRHALPAGHAADDRVQQPARRRSLRRRRRSRSSPRCPAVKVVQQGRYVTIIGGTRAHTTYKVTVSAGLLDHFGQTLGADARPSNSPSATPEPNFIARRGWSSSTRPRAADPRRLHRQLHRLEVRLYGVTPADSAPGVHYLRNRWNKQHPPSIPGKKVFDQLV